MIVTSCSFSSDRKLSRCEMQFYYRYGEKLKKKVKKIGLFRGDWMHQLLEAHYNATGWEKKFKSLKKDMWKPLFDEEKEEYGLDFPDTIEELMTHYTEHWHGWDNNWVILHVEKAFELPLKGLPFPLRWKADLVVKEKDSGRVILVESKAKKAIPDSSERILQPQVHSYAWLLSKVGIKIDGILWNYIRTEPVPRPQILKDGSLSERKINTDQRSYMKSMKEAGIHPKGEEFIGLENKLQQLPDTLSLERINNTVNLALGERFVKEWVERHRRALAIKKPLVSWNRNCKWDCDYYELCQVDMLGKVDREMIIKKDYLVNITGTEELK